jgi:hypothetical protein
MENRDVYNYTNVQHCCAPGLLRGLAPTASKENGRKNDCESVPDGP